MANEYKIATGKQQRKALQLFYVAAEGEYELIGRRIESTGIEKSAEVESVKDITGETIVDLTSYENTTDLDPIYVEGGVKFSEKIDDMEEQEALMDKAILNFMWAKMYKSTTDGKYRAWTQSAVVKIKSLGGDVKGVNMPVTLHWIGNRVLGGFDPAAKEFTPDA